MLRDRLSRREQMQKLDIMVSSFFILKHDSSDELVFNHFFNYLFIYLLSEYIAYVEHIHYSQASESGTESYREGALAASAARIEQTPQVSLEIN